jgi:pSer/pThr/pTyr-binding forkhead associated (FHA) protein
MKVRLKVTDGCRRTVTVHSPEFVIGRDSDCDLQLKSPLVSRHHCALTVQDGEVYVRDLQSRNGTGLNNQIVIDQRRLHDGDQLWVAATPIEIWIRGERTVASSMAGGSLFRHAEECG